MQKTKGVPRFNLTRTPIPSPSTSINSAQHLKREGSFNTIQNFEKLRCLRLKNKLISNELKLFCKFIK